MSSALRLRTVSSLSEIAAADWNHCAGDDSPFLSHEFLLALELSGSADTASGWQPCHLVIETESGEIQAVAPLYGKSHSYGEYVFDWAWAEAWQNAGRPYYPKLQCAVPFTPATGPRLLTAPGADRGALIAMLGNGMIGLAQENRLSSAHITFLTEEEAQILAQRGWMLRIGEQFHWDNRGYRDFADFLDALASRKRKAIRKERSLCDRHGLTIEALSGADLKAEHWDAFYRFYLDTVERKWAHAYLQREFFDRVAAALADKTLLMIARQDGRIVAGALNFIGADTLFGRNWGCEGEFRFLHFELCYYRAIEFAIAKGLKRVEAGAQGEHKLSRGYLPTPTFSVHWIREEPFRAAIGQFLARERQAVLRQIELGQADGPYRRE